VANLAMNMNKNNPKQSSSDRHTSLLLDRSVDNVISTDELSRRPSRAPNYATECQALVALAEMMADSPGAVLQGLADAALQLCGAGSSGISIAEEESPEPVFRWHATAGAFAPLVGSTLPRAFSPCGTVLERNSLLMMTQPAEYFPYISDIAPFVREVLLAPFCRDGIAIGTVWVVSHEGDRRFDAEDARVLESLAKFASAAHKALTNVSALETANEDRDQAAKEVARVATESERQRRVYETALSNTVDFNYVFDLDGRFTYVNRALLALWGKSLSEAVGKNFFELDYPPDLAARLQQQIQHVIATKQTIRDETPYTSAIGTRAYEYIFAPVFGADGTVEAVAGSTRDITERKQAEQDLREADRRKNEFLATLAHELRNPLAPISNALQAWSLIQNDEEQLDKTREMMERQVHQMIRLVDDLLDISRITRGKIELHRERLDLATVVEGALEGVRPFIDAHRHELSVELPAEPVALDGDVGRLMQIFANIIHNAAKYTGRNGHIRVVAQCDGDSAVVSVRDDGPGIPREKLDSIFEMFSQVDQTLNRAHGGLGIGLTLVKSLVELHGGSVHAFSEGPGQGSEFVVRLPIADDSVEASRISPKPSAELPSHRVLVVDDMRPSAKTLAMMLTGLGQETQVAFDGPSALEIAERFRPGLAIVDIAMPGMDGYEVAKRIRAMKDYRPVLVALTGYGQEKDRRQAFEAGFDHHLVKPISSDALHQLLETVPSSEDRA